MFNIIRQAGRKRIRDRGIKWVEKYHERSLPLKKRYTHEIGPGSYYRWEGHDYTTDGDYFVVAGPALTRDLKKRFFAGIKRLPKDPGKKVFAPSGEYFSTLHGALSFATERWGVRFPRGTYNYSLNDLANINIPRHIKASDMRIIKTAKFEKQSQSRLPSQIRNTLNNGIHPITQGYHDQIPLNDIFNILSQNNIQAVQEDGTPWTGFLMGNAECGSDEAASQRVHFDLAFRSENGLVPITNASLFLSWCTMQSGKYEINAYVT